MDATRTTSPTRQRSHPIDRVGADSACGASILKRTIGVALLAVFTCRHQRLHGYHAAGVIGPALALKRPIFLGLPIAVVPILPNQIGRAHVWTPVTNAHLVCRLLLEKKKITHHK